MIMTVTGEKSENDLGLISAHEHIFIDMRKLVDTPLNASNLFFGNVTAENRGEVFSDPYAIRDNALLDNFDDALNEVIDFKNAGGSTIVDCTLDEIGRKPLVLKEISQKSGVNIIVGCGHYYDKAHTEYVKNATVSELADEMIRDIEVGIGDTGVRAGVIGEIGTSAVISENEKKVLIAAGIAANRTKKGIHIHTDLYTENGFEVIDTLTNEGVLPEKICINHIDVWLRTDYIKALLKRGVYIEFDNFGKEFYVSEKRRFAYDLERIKVLKELIDEGYKDQILISNDICLKTMWKKYGGTGYSHILKTVQYMAEENGIDRETYLSILSDNVIKFLK